MSTTTPTTPSPAPRRPRMKAMTLTDAAADRIRQVMAGKPGVVGLRLGVKNGGCAGQEYTMAWAETQDRFDEVVEDKGVKILIDPKAILFLLGTEMDFQVDRLSSRFVFNNPNQKSACGCGESIKLEAAPKEQLDALKA